MDGHDSLNLTSLSLLYRFANVLHIWTLYVTAEHILTRMVRSSFVETYSVLPVLSFIQSL
jgi:hypothetical protein